MNEDSCVVLLIRENHDQYHGWEYDGDDSI